MKRKLLLLAVILAVLAIAGGTFAYTATSASLSTSVTSSAFVAVQSWNGTMTWGKYDALPTWTPLVGSAGAVDAGDLYYIENPGSGYTGNLLVTLYLTNPGDLADSYSYMNFEVQAYDYNGTTWTSKDIDAFLTMSNGYVSFVLPPATGTGWVITIDGGSWYCIGTSHLDPTFFLEVKQA